MLNKIILITALLLTPLLSYGESINLRIGKGAVAKQKTANYYSIVHSDNILDIDFLVKKTELGYYSTDVDKNAFTLFRMYGLKFGTDIKMELIVGAGLISHVGSRLGSRFQFTEEFNILYSSFILGYKHISNAGIIRPNLGRDFINLGVNVEL